MKKFLLIVTAMMLIMTASFAQQVRKAPDGTPKPMVSTADAYFSEQPSNRATIYSEGFESTTGTPIADGVNPTYTPPLPTGWTLSYTTGHGWGTVSNLTDVPGCGDDFLPHTGTRMMYNTWSSAGNKWAFSPGFTLAAGTAYTIKFWWSAPGWPSLSEPDKFEVRIGTTATATAMATATQVFNHPGLYYSYPYSWTEATYTFTPTAAGTYYLGFHDLRGPGSQYGLCIMIDDILITDGSTSTDVTITTAVNPAGAGNVTGGGTKPSGSNYTLTATANAGYTFDKWTPGNSTTNPLQLTNVTANATYTANFNTTSTNCNPPTNLNVAYNTGCSQATLTWTAPVAKNRAQWDVLFSFDAPAGGHVAVASDGNNFYTVPWNTSGPPAAAAPFQKYTMQGVPVGGTFTVGPTTNPTVHGIRSLTYDGQYFYAGCANTTVLILDLANQALIGTITVPSAARHITYDPTLDGGNGGFWIGDWGTIRSIKKNGTAISTLITHSGPTNFPSCYGTAFDKVTDPANPCIWMNCQDGSVNGGVQETKIMKFDINTMTLLPGIQHNVKLDFPTLNPPNGPLAGGLFGLTLNGKWCLAVNMQVTPNKIAIYEISGGTTPTNATYNVYRGTQKLNTAGPVTATTFTDNTFTSTEGYTWSVKAICPTSGESAAATKVMDACAPSGNCNPPTNLNVAYNDACSAATLTWTAPVAKSATTTYLGENYNSFKEASTRRELGNARSMDLRALAKGSGSITRDFTLSPGAFNMPCGAMPDNLYIYDDGWDYVTGTNSYEDEKFGYVFKGTAGNVVSVKAWLVKVWDGENENIFAELWTLNGSDIPTTKLATSQPISAMSISGTEITEYTFTFATPVAVPANFAAVIKVPKYRENPPYETGIAIATSELDCYAVGTGRYSLVYNEWEGGWNTMVDSWGWEDPGMFDLAIFPVMQGGTPTNVTYNVYRDNVKINTSGPVTTTTYTDNNFTASAGHTWAVKAICPTTGESAAASKTKDACSDPQGDCNPPKNITVDYALGCGTATIKWEAPDGKKNLKDKTPITPEPFLKSPQGAIFKSAGNPTQSPVETRGIGDWLKWSGAFNEGIGVGGPVDFIVAARYTPADLTANNIVSGNSITSVRFAVEYKSSVTSVTIYIYEGGTSPTNPGNLVYTQLVTQPLLEAQIMQVDLDEPFVIDASKELWVGYRMVQNYYCAGTDFGPRVVGKGDLMYYNEAWTDLYAASNNSISQNWNIEALIGDKPIYYNLYRNDNLIAENIGKTNYIDNKFNSDKAHVWSVAAVCEGGGESGRISQSMPACNSTPPGACNPAKNLAVAYADGCMTANLTWETPDGKKSIDNPFTPLNTEKKERVDVNSMIAHRAPMPEGATGRPAPSGGDVTDLRAYADAYTFIYDGNSGNVTYNTINLTTGALAPVTPSAALGAFPTGEDFYDGDIYRLYANGLVVKVDENGGTTTIGTIAGLSSDITPIGLAYDWVTNDGTWYFTQLNSTGGNFPMTQSLYKLTMPSLTKTLIGTTPSTSTDIHRGLAMSNNGTLYAIKCVNNGIGSLVTISKTNGAVTTVGSLGMNTWFGQDLAFDRQANILYGVLYDRPTSTGKFGTINTTSGAFAQIQSCGSYIQCGTLVITKDANVNLPKSPTNVTLTPTGKTLTGTLAWTNPGQTINGTALTAITKIVVLRDGVLFQEITTGVTVGAAMTLPVTVTTAGKHKFEVYAVTAAGKGQKTGATAVFGSVCEVEVDITYVFVGDELSWTVTDAETGTLIMGGGPQATGSNVSTGTFTEYIGKDAIFKIWGHDVSWYDNDIDMTVKIGGELVYQCAYKIFNEGEMVTRDLECGYSIKYFVYRDGKHITTTKTTAYADKAFNSSTAHTWDVRVLCEDNTLSVPVSATKEPCGNMGTCNPPTNLEVVYNDPICSTAELTWTEPGKKSRDIAAENNLLIANSNAVMAPSRDEAGATSAAMSTTRNKSTGIPFKPEEEEGGDTRAIWDVMWSFNVESVQGSGGSFSPFMWDGVLYINKWSTTYNPGFLGKYVRNGSTWTYAGTQTLTGIPVGAINPEGFATDGEFIYACTGGSNIYKINPATWTSVATISVPGQNIDGIAYDAVQDCFWIAEYQMGYSAKKVAKTGGAVLQTLTGNTSLRLADIAWENSSDGTPYLWMTAAETGNKNLHRWNLTTGAFQANAKTTTDIPLLASAGTGAGLFTGIDTQTGKKVMIGLCEATDIAFCYEIGSAGTQCAPITNLQYTVTGNTVNLTWTAATGSPTGYEVKRNGTTLQTVTTTSFTDTNVPDGQHSYSVTAKFTETCYPQAVSTPQFIVGSMCPIKIEFGGLYYDSYMGYYGTAGVEVFVDGVSKGTFLGDNLTGSSGNYTKIVTPLLPGGDIEVKWITGGYSTEKWIKIYDVNNVQVGGCGSPGCVDGWPAGYIIAAFDQCSNAVKYNVYRDGELLAEKLKVTNFTDKTYNPEDNHVWEVKVICENGMSTPATKEKESCFEPQPNCAPIKNLTYESWEDCRIVLNWEKPDKGATDLTPIVPPYTQPTAAQIKADAQKAELESVNAKTATLRANPNQVVYETGENEEFRGPTSNVFLTMGASPYAVHKGTVTNPFGAQIGTSGGAVQCLEYINNTIYGVRWSSGNQFGTINPTTGAWTNIKTSFHTQGTDGVSICHNPANGLTYVFPWTGEAPEATRFGTVNLANGDFTTIATFPLDISYTYYAAIDQDGTCYAVRHGSKDFGTVNLATGAFTVKAVMSGIAGDIQYIQDLSFDRETGELYWIAQTTGGNFYYKINKATGALTNLGSSSLNAQGFTTQTEWGTPNPPCPAVTNVTAAVVSGTQNVNITWTAATGSPTGYEITRNGEVLTTVTGTSYTHNNVPVGVQNYCVTAKFPTSAGCNEQSVCAPAVTVNEVLGGGCDAAVVGTATTGEYRAPLNTYWNYSYTQQIYGEAEVGTTGTITSISFEYIHPTPEYPTTVNVYMGHTTKSTFASVTDFIPVSELTLVYSGPMTFKSATQWSTIALASEFDYTGGNLVVAIQNNKGSNLNNTTSSFRHTATTGNKTIWNYRDSGAIDPANPGAGTVYNTGSPAATRPNTRFVICTPAGYNIYKNGDFLTFVDKPTYTDFSADNTIPNEYCIKVTCEDGGESKPVCVTVPPCTPKPCGTVQNLTAEYGLDCQFATLSWKSPILPKSRGIVPEVVIEPATSTGPQLTEAEKLAIENGGMITNRQGSIISTPYEENEPEITRAPRGMVNVTLKASNDLWEDGTGYQMLIGPTSLWGTTIPTTGPLAVCTHGNPNLYSPFTYKIPTNADPVCTTNNIVVFTDVTIQVPAGTYSYCITNPSPAAPPYNQIWIAGGDNGRKASYTFVDGQKYSFKPIVVGTGDGIQITIEPDGTPCPAVTGVTAAVIAGTAQVKVNWTPVTGATSTEVTRDGTVIATLGATANTYTDAAATPGSHVYAVKAIFPASNDCIPVTVAAPAVMVPEILSGGCEYKTVLTGTGTTDVTNSPVYFLYEYSYNQIIFTEAELGLSPGQTISSIGFNCVSTSTKLENVPVTLYMGHTTKNEWAAANAAEFIPLSQLQLVFTGTKTFNNANTWTTIEFTEPFTYTGGNIVVGVYQAVNTNWTTGTFKGGTLTNYRNLRVYTTTAFTPNSLPSTTNYARDYTRANVRFKVCEDQKEYNIYRDGVLIEANYKGNTYTDDIANGMNPKEDHCWTVAYIREGPHNLECEGLDVCLDKCADVECEQTVATVGTGTTGGYHPFAGFYGFQRNIMLYQASEINGAGPITKLEFYITSLNTSSRPVKIYIMPTTANILNAQYIWNDMKSAATLVYDASTAFPAIGWREFVLNAPYMYDGAQNLLVLIEGTGCTLIGGCSVQASYTVKTSCHWYSRKDNTPPDDHLMAGTLDNNRPNVRITIDCDPINVDMAATAISLCPTLVKAGVPYDVEVTVINRGIEEATDYTVAVHTYPDMIPLASVNGPALALNASAKVLVPVTFSKTGELTLRGRVQIDGDMNPLNNQTPNLKVTVRPNDDDEVVEIPCPANVGATAYAIPFNFYYRNSMVQSLYTEAEIGLAGGYIKDITWFYNNTATNAVVNRPIKIYMAVTDQTSLASAWLPLDKFTLVYEGTADVPLGISELKKTLTTPFLYMGGNLVVMTERIFNSDTDIQANAMVTTVTPASRTRTYQSDTAPFNWSQPGSTLNTISNIRLTFYVAPAGVVEGTASCSGTPVEGVKITLKNENNPALTFIKTTNAAGYYKYQYVPVGIYSMHAEKFAYFDQDIDPFSVEKNVTYVKNLDAVCLLPEWTVFGAVANAAGELLVGAKVEMKGYQNYSTVTNEWGAFDFPFVYAPKNYVLTITYPGYKKYTDSTLYVTGNTNLGTIILYEIPYPPIDVRANEVGQFAEITWKAPDGSGCNGGGPGGGEEPFDPIVENCESYTAFQKNPTGAIAWTYYENGINTYGITNVTFPGSGTNFAYIAFNPGATSPSLASEPDFLAHAGNQYFASFATTTAANNHWLISPILDTDKELKITFWAKSVVDDYGLERMKVRYSTTDNTTASFTNYLAGSASSYVSVPVVWTKYEYIIPATAKYVAIQCVSDDAFIFMIDDISIVENGKKAGFNYTENIIPDKASSGIYTKTSVLVPIPGIEPIPATTATRDLSRGILGYKLWRLTPGQEENQSTWVQIISNPVNALKYTDISWTSTPVGEYRWAVATCYHGGVESCTQFSDTLVKRVEVKYTIQVSTNTNEPPTGAVVTLIDTVNNQTYSQIAPSSGTVVFAKVWNGDYKLTVTLFGYDTEKHNLTVTEAGGTYPVTLKETINDPKNVEVDIDLDICNAAKVTWEHVADRCTGFSIYLNDALVAKTTQNEYVLTMLPDGDYTVCVEANYKTGDSKCVKSDEFSIICTGITNLEPGDYMLYPNPTDNKLFVERASNERAVIEIYNAMGMFINRFETTVNRFEINVSDFAAGTYFIRLTEGAKTGVKGFVKK